MFIHKDVFTDAETYLRAIFKSQGQANLLSQQRVSRARTMLTPFVLRRRKAQVLDLPPKIEKVQHCEMTTSQARLYRDTLQRSKKILEELSDDALDQAAVQDDEQLAKKPAANGKGKAVKNGKVEKKKGSLCEFIVKYPDGLAQGGESSAFIQEVVRGCEDPANRKGVLEHPDVVRQ